MPICLYCTKSADTDEHPLPASLGEFKDAPMITLCKSCNNKLGILDEQLSRSGPEAFMRRFYGVQGRSTHTAINPHYRGSAGGGPIKMTSFDESLGIDVPMEIVRGNEARQMRQLIFREVSGKIIYLPLPDTLRAPVQLKAAFDNLCLSEIADAQVIYDPEDSDWVEPLVSAVWPQVVFENRTLTPQKHHCTAKVEFQVTDRYFRSIAKIGFHYFLSQFPQYGGGESKFELIRKFICDDGPIYRANEFIGERQHPLLGNLHDGGRPDGWQAHCLAAEIKGGICRAHVQLFICEHFPSIPYSITLAKAESTAVTEDVGFGHAYLYFENGLMGKFAGETLRCDYASILGPQPPLKAVIG